MKITYHQQVGDPNVVIIGGITFAHGVPVEVDEHANPHVANNCIRNSGFVVTYPPYLKPVPHAELDRVLTRTIEQFKRPTRMSKFSAVAERMAKLKTEDEAAADALMERMDAHEKRRPEVVAKGHAFLDGQKAEMDDAESGLTQLGNVFEAASGESQKA